METEKKTLRKWILLILVLLIPITAVLVALRISQAASREKEMNRPHGPNTAHQEGQDVRETQTNGWKILP